MTRRSLLAWLCGIPALLGLRDARAGARPHECPSAWGTPGHLVTYTDRTDGRVERRTVFVPGPYRSALG